MGASHSDLSQDDGSQQQQEQSKTEVQGNSNDITTAIHNTTAKEVSPFPHNYEEILKRADSNIDRSSKDKLFDQLHAGIYLDQKKKKYWVERESRKNCFMIFARDLLITWADDDRYWHWPLLKESSEESVAVAELLNVCWLEVHGRFETANLSPGTMYEVFFIVMIKDPAYGWEVPVNLRLTLPDGGKQERKESLMEKPRGRWVELLAGELRSAGGEMEVSLYEYEHGEWKRGLLVKGILIRPKT